MKVVRLSRRVVLLGAGTAGLLAAGPFGCGEGAGELLDDLFPVHPLDEPGDDEMPQQVPEENSPYSDPLILYGSSTISAGGGGGANTFALSNPDDLDMDLLEVRWRIYTNPDAVAAAAGNARIMAGLGVGVKMDMGVIPVVDSDVPLSGFGTTRDFDEPAANDHDAIYPDPTVTTTTVYPYSYRWRLKYPLLVPGGAVLTPQFSHLGQVPFPVTIDSVYVCRQRPVGQRRPDSVKVPWVGSYNSIPFDNVAGQAAGSDASSEADLYNPFGVPLEIARLTGSCVLNSPLSALYEWFGDQRYRMGKVRMQSKRGGELARVPTPFNGLFPIEWRAWDIPSGWIMAPGEYYKVQLAMAAMDYTPATNTIGPVQFMISAVGYREVPINEFITAAFSEPEVTP